MRALFLHRQIFTGALAITMLLSASAFAEPNMPSPKDMYQKDYVTGPGNDEEQRSDPSASSQKVPNGKKPSTPKTPSKATGQTGAVQNSRTSGTPIQSIGVILNGLDRKHFDQYLEELADVLKERKLPLGELYLIGTGRAYSSAEKDDYLRKWSLPLNFIHSPPKPYDKVSRSPTWIIQTAQGRILLEGLTNLSRYVNDRGELVVSDDLKEEGVK